MKIIVQIEERIRDKKNNYEFKNKLNANLSIPHRSNRRCLLRTLDEKTIVLELSQVNKELYKLKYDLSLKSYEHRSSVQRKIDDIQNA